MHHSNAICNVRGVEKLSPQGVGKGNHLIKKSYEGLISRLEEITWENLNNDKISGNSYSSHYSPSKAIDVQLKTATKKKKK